MMPIDELQGLLLQAFPAAQIHLNSPMKDDNHFQLLIVSDAFDGKSMVEQHQLVYGALGGAMQEAVHALSIKTLTPAQWEKEGAGR